MVVPRRGRFRIAGEEWFKLFHLPVPGNDAGDGIGWFSGIYSSGPSVPIPREPLRALPDFAVQSLHLLYSGEAGLLGVADEDPVVGFGGWDIFGGGGGEWGAGGSSGF